MAQDAAAQIAPPSTDTSVATVLDALKNSDAAKGGGAAPANETGVTGQDLKAKAEKTAADADMPSWKRDLPEEFHADNVEEALAKAVARAKGLRDKLAKGENKVELPESADKYELDPGEAYKALNPDADFNADPMVVGFRNAAFELGIPPEGAQKLLSAAIDAGFEAGVIEKPIDMKDFVEAVGGQADYDRITNDYGSRILAAKAAGTFGDDPKAADAAVDALFTAFADNPAAAKALHQLVTAKSLSSLTVPSVSSGELELTQGNLEKMSADPRYDKDPSYRQKVDALWDEYDRQKAG